MDLFEFGTYVVGIVGALSTGMVFVWRARRSATEKLRADLARRWTNEGDVSGGYSHFVDLDLSLHDGDLLGTVTTNRVDESLGAHVDVSWWKADLRVTRLRGRDLEPIGDVRLRLTGNRNRIDWKLRQEHDPGILPERTLLWPSAG